MTFNLQNVKTSLEHFSYLLKSLPPPVPQDFNDKFELEKIEYDRKKAEITKKVEVLQRAYDLLLEEVVQEASQMV